jgi:hypothetical protein
MILLVVCFFCFLFFVIFVLKLKKMGHPNLVMNELKTVIFKLRVTVTLNIEVKVGHLINLIYL